MIGGFEYFVREGPGRGRAGGAPRRGLGGLVGSWSETMAGCSLPSERSVPLRDAYGAGTEHGDARGARRIGARRPGSTMRCGTCPQALVAPGARGALPGRRRPSGRSPSAGAGCSAASRRRLPLGDDDAVSAVMPRSRSGPGSAWSAISTRATGRCSTAAPSAGHGCAAGTCCCSARRRSASASPRTPGRCVQRRGVERVESAAARDRQRVERPRRG